MPLAISGHSVPEVVTLFVYMNVEELCANEDQDVADANTDENTIVAAV